LSKITTERSHRDPDVHRDHHLTMAERDVIQNLQMFGQSRKERKEGR